MYMTCTNNFVHVYSCVVLHVTGLNEILNQVNKLALTGKNIVSGLSYLCVHHILCDFGFRAYLLVRQEEGEFFL